MSKGSRLRVDLTGQTFGYLQVVEFAERRAGKAHWACVCRCGSSVIADGHNLKSGHSTSCGCKKKEAPPGAILHGLSKTKAHRIWRKMLERCRNPRASCYHRYGGRGIRVCDRWLEFKAFYEDMGDPPDGFSIDRIDNDGPYSPENCRWATDLEQAANKSTTKKVTRDGRTLTLREWCEELGLPVATIRRRVELGWPESDWLLPLRPRREQPIYRRKTP